jgi:xanthine dehydrogenase YagS FAD-binding subunit
MNRFEWSEARGLAEAAAAAADGATLKAGGVDLLDLMKEGLLAPRRLVALRPLAELARIEPQPDGSLRIGALVTLAQLAAQPQLRERYRALAEAAAGSASPQIRNMATLGGNLLQRPRCWYFRSLAHRCARKGGDVCFAFDGENAYHAIFGQNGCAMVHPSTAATALVALGARVELLGPAGQGRSVALEDFFVRPEQDIRRENDLKAGEILTAVRLPPARGLRSAHLRQGELQSFDWPLADVAVALELDAGGVCRKASVVLGAAAPVPYRASQAEAALAGKRIDEAAARAAAHAALAGAMPLRDNAYKLPIFEALVRRAILAAAGRDG